MTSATVNDTMRNFGYPETVIAETNHWVVLLRPQQITLGSLVLICREEVEAFGSVSPEGFARLQPAIAQIETVLHRFTGYLRINYLMLMMVDKDVHFHVIPRYEGERSFRDVTFPDAGWPGPPTLGAFVAPDANQIGDLVGELRALWTEAGAPAS